MSIAQDLNTVPVTAPIDTDSAGRLGDIATHAVIRLLCLERNEVGTGFLHKSGNLITADHVVRGCSKPQMVMSNGSLDAVTIVATDQDHDLALVKPNTPITAKPLEIAKKPTTLRLAPKSLLGAFQAATMVFRQC
jgi:hypothetical protein